MEYREIVAVTGLGGLYHLLATKSDGAIVRNLVDKSTKFISARLHNVTPLESIEIYTTGENVRLHVVLQKMKDSTEQTPVPDVKLLSNDQIKSYFADVFPELDKDRVYVSDMKKILKWYELLRDNELLNFDALDAAEEAPEAVVEEEAPAAEKPAKKARTKKAETTEADAAAEEKPAKKTAKKKAETVAEEGGEPAPKKATRAKKKKEE